MSVLSQIFNTLEQRVLHVPNADLAMVVDAYNAEATAAGRATITAEGWRDFERTQAAYTAHRLQRQATPQNPLLAGAVGTLLTGGGKK